MILNSLMKFIAIIFLSLLLPQYFSVGDQVSISDQNDSYYICYEVDNDQIIAEYPQNTIKLADLNGELNGGDYKIVVFKFTCSCTGHCFNSIEGFDELILDWGDNPDVVFINSLYEPNQPYSCEMWGDFGIEGIPLVFSDSQFTLQFVDIGFPLYVIFDHTMTINYRGIFSSYTISNRINQLLELLPPIIGDLNGDGVLNIIDVIDVVNIILGEEEYNILADMNSDGIINIIDVIDVVNIILADN